MLPRREIFVGVWSLDERLVRNFSVGVMERKLSDFHIGPSSVMAFSILPLRKTLLKYSILARLGFRFGVKSTRWLASSKPAASMGTAIVGDVCWFIRFGEDGFGGDKVRWSRPKVKWELWPEVNAVAIKPPSATGGSQAESGGGGSSVLTGSQAPSPMPRQGGTHPGPTPGTRPAASSEPAASNAPQPAAAAPNADNDEPEETKRSARRKRKKERDVRQIADLEEETRRLRERLTAVEKELAVFKKAEETKRARKE